MRRRKVRLHWTVKTLECKRHVQYNTMMKKRLGILSGSSVRKSRGRMSPFIEPKTSQLSKRTGSGTTLTHSFLIPHSLPRLWVRVVLGLGSEKTTEVQRRLPLSLTSRLSVSQLSDLSWVDRGVLGPVGRMTHGSETLGEPPFRLS